MKKHLLLLFLIGMTTVLVNCNKEEEQEDLTPEIIGDYIGAYGNNNGADINPYEIVVTKIENNRILVTSKTGNEFTGFETDIIRLNSSNIASPNDNNQQVEKSVEFMIGTPTGMTMNIDPLGEGHLFIGTKVE